METFNLAWDYVVLEADSTQVQLNFESNEDDFEGFWDDYVSLHVCSPDTNLQNQSPQVSRFYFGQNQIVKGLYLITDTITKHENQETIFKYTFDAGLIIELEDSFLGISMNSTRHESIAIDFAQDIEELKLPGLGGRWESDLVTSYTVSRQVNKITT
jgi:hypothetical protein